MRLMIITSAETKVLPAKQLIALHKNYPYDWETFETTKDFEEMEALSTAIMEQFFSGEDPMTVVFTDDFSYLIKELAAVEGMVKNIIDNKNKDYPSFEVKVFVDDELV